MTVQEFPRSATGRRPRVRRKPPRQQHDLGWWLLWPLEQIIPNKDSPTSSAATVVRLFYSAHVKDLRLIAGIAWALGFYGLLIVLLLSFWPALLAAADTGLHVASHTASSIAAPTTRQIAADQGGLVGFSSFIKTFAAPLGVLAAVISWAYLRGSARLGIVDLFACEISTLCRVATLVDTAERCIHEYRTRWVAPEESGARVPAQAYAFSSNEDYFPIFGANSHDLESLEARVVINITAFYTYMKAVRDMRRGLQAITPLPSDQLADTGQEPDPGSWREAMRNQIYMLFLALESARKSVEDLVEFEPEQAERTIVILISELRAYSFLCAHYPKEDDIRRKRLLLRKSGYIRETRACIRTVEAGMRSRGSRKKRLWKPAAELLGQLQACYEDALRAASDDPMAPRAAA